MICRSSMNRFSSTCWPKHEHDPLQLSSVCPMHGLNCPVCHLALALSDDKRSLRCNSGHHFDRAKQGYFNLLLSQHKKSKQPGDDVEMVQARRAFLDTGLYAPLAKAIQSIAVDIPYSSAPCSPAPYPLAMTDIACGEGYYTDGLHRALSKQLDRKVICTGVDISVPAIKAACRREHEIQWLVASANRLPIESASQDLATCLFCRIDIDEASRILKSGAHLITASTGPEHLLELRSLLYGDKLKHKGPAPVLETPKLAHISRQFVSFQVQIEHIEDRENLLRMTPHYWRSSADDHQRVLSESNLQTGVEVYLDLYQKQEL